MNEKFEKIKNRVKSRIKDHAPELITVGASALALVTYAIYVTRTSNSNVLEDTDIVIMESNGDGHAVVSAMEAVAMKDGTSKLRYKLDDDHYFNFVQTDNPTE